MKKFIIFLFLVTSVFANKTVTYSYDPDWKPFEWKNNIGKHTGIIPDILELIHKKTGITFIAVPTNSWKETLDNLKTQKVQMVSAIGKTPQREKWLNFSKNNIVSVPYIFVVRKGRKLDINFQNKNNKKIALLANSTMVGVLKKEIPNFKADFYAKTLQDGLKLVEEKKADVFLLNLVSAKYFINKKFHNLKILKKTKYKLNLKIAFTKKVSIETINKIDNALALIPETKINEIYNKWTKPKQIINYRLIFGILAGIIIIFILIVWHNRKLSKLVKEKTKHIEKQKDELIELNNNLEKIVIQRTKELETAYRNMKDNIEYASFIQNAILPKNDILNNFIKEHFIILKEKDLVGGDIYFIEEISDDEIIVMVIDGAGHGVSGAFVTMFVKGIESQIIHKIKSNELEKSPAKILEYFNVTIKKMLNQPKRSSSNAGFDGGILYYNKSTKSIKYAGAKTPLYILQNNEIEIIKGDRKNVGFARTKIEQSYSEYEKTLNENSELIITTDGIIDQEGEIGQFGKERFIKLIKEISNENLKNQKKLILEEFENFKKEKHQIDDITVIGLKI